MYYIDTIKISGCEVHVPYVLHYNTKYMYHANAILLWKGELL